MDKLCCPVCGSDKIVEADTSVYDLTLDCFGCIEYTLIEEATYKQYVCKDCNHVEDTVAKYIVG